MNRDSFLFGILFGILPMSLGTWQLWRELSPRRWSKVTGLILSSRIDVAPVQRRGKEFTPVIEYEYYFNEHSFRSSQRRMGNYASGQSIDAETVRSRYPVGKSVTVFISPKRPDKSVLEYGMTPLSWIPIGFGLLFTLLAFLAHPRF